MVTAKQVLATPVQDGNDAGADTVGDYLVKLLEVLWTEGAGFDGKRPFGNSGWQSDLWAALIRAGHVAGSFDGDGYVESLDSEAVDRLIAAAVQELRAAWSG